MLSERLRDHLDEVAPPLTLDEVRERPPAELPVDFGLAERSGDSVVFEFETAEPEQPRSRALAIAAAVVIVVLVGGFALTLLSPDRQDLSTADGIASAVPLPTLPGDLSTAEWWAVATPFTGLQEGTSVQVSDVVSSGGVAWAVGSEGLLTGEIRQLADPELGFVGRAAVWRSVEGEEWEPVDLGLERLDDPVAQVTDVEALDFAVATSDGAIWTFGSYLFLDEPNHDFGGQAIGYRSLDGESWQRLQLPLPSAMDSTVTAVSSDGPNVLIETQEVDFATGVPEISRSFVTTDGETWTPVGEPRQIAQEQSSLLIDGEVVTVTPAALPSEAILPVALGSGPGFVVMLTHETGLVSGAMSNDEDFNQDVDLWLSEDGNIWEAVDVPSWDVSGWQTARGLFSHNSGVLAHIVQNTAEGARTLLTNVDGSGVVEDLGVLPPAVVHDIFSIDGELFLLGRTQSPADTFEQIPESIWVAEFPQQAGDSDEG